MKKLNRIAVFLILFQILLPKARTYDGGTPEYSGFIGCLFSSSICRLEEECVDDGLFGSCQRFGANSQDLYWYQLNSMQLVELETVLHKLAASGYTWRHLYTQCRVMSTLLSYRYGVALRNDFCENGETSWKRKSTESKSISKESTGQLLNDLIDMLNAKISVTNKETSDDKGRQAKGNSQQREKPQFFHSGPDGQQSDDKISRFLRRLSESDLRVLKEFLIQQVEESRYEDRAYGGKSVLEKNETLLGVSGASVVVKKVDPSVAGTITRVVVHYDPGSEETSEEGELDLSSKGPSQDNTEPKKTAKEEVLWSVSPVPRVIDHEGYIIGTSAPPVDVVSYHGEHADQVSPNITPASSSTASELNKSLAAGQTALMTSTAEENSRFMIPLYVLCGLVAVVIIAAIVLVLMRHNSHLKEKLRLSSGHDVRKKEARIITGDYQDLCREDMRMKMEERKPGHASSDVVEPSSKGDTDSIKALQRSGALSRPEDRVALDMDISTGHMILSYMEDHLKNKDKLEKDWNLLCSYDAEPQSIVAAIEPTNMRKNRYADIMPYEHTRVRLNPVANVNSSDYINANNITDHDPRFPAYIAAQGPLPHTVSDFWQMIWEQGTTTIVCLTRLIENDSNICYRYWPSEGSDLYHIYEVKLISEHNSSCGDFVVRSFCLRNTETNETRTVTQFHYLSWPHLGVPSSVKTLMDFRNKVNHSYHGRFSPIIVHCSDGAGQTGTYCLIDMVLTRLRKGAKKKKVPTATLR